jgi:hypothetical protein
MGVLRFALTWLRRPVGPRPPLVGPEGRRRAAALTELVRAARAAAAAAPADTAFVRLGPNWATAADTNGPATSEPAGR